MSNLDDRVNQAAEKKFKEAIMDALKRKGCEQVKVTFSGSVARNDLKAHFSGPSDQCAEAEKRVSQKR
jgi:hypothetical protein